MRPLAPPALARVLAPRGPFELDPARVLLCAAPDAAAAARALERLAGEAAIAWAEPNRARAPCAWSLEGAAPPAAGARAGEWRPDDPLFVNGRQWGLEAIGAPRAWVWSRGDTAVRLAVADTGVDPRHPDLEGGPVARLVHARNVAGANPAAWADSFGHGTPVAGVVAARSNNGATFDSLGIAALAGGDGDANAGCRLVPIRMTASRSGLASSFAIAEAILHAVAVGARAVNVSFAGGHPSALERGAMLHAIARGCLVVAAIGNRGATDGAAPMYPAAYAADGLGLAVGAHDRDGRRAAFSSHGPGLDLLAPGVDVWTTFLTHPSWAGAVHPGYVRASGTSFAAPFATAAAGVLVAARPALGADDVRALLREAARDLGAPGPDSLTGAGALDAAAAIERLGPGVAILHDERAADAVRRLGADTLVVTADGPGALARGAHPAELHEVTATVAIPDSFAAEARVWPRVSGTFAVRAGFRLAGFVPFAEIAARDGRTVTLRGFLYRRTDAPDDAAWVPVPPDQARFGFTVLGPRRPAIAAAAAPGALAAAPVPFRDAVTLRGRPHARVALLDPAGRRVREVVLDSGGRFVWNGRDDAGRPLPPGLILARDLDAPPGPAVRIVRLR